MIAAVGGHTPEVYVSPRRVDFAELRGGFPPANRIIRPVQQSVRETFYESVKNRTVPMLNLVLTRKEVFDRFPGLSLSGDPAKPYSWPGKKIDPGTKVHVWIKKTSNSPTRKKDFSDAQVVAIYPDLPEFKTPSIPGWSNERDCEVWENHAKFLKMSPAKLFFKRLAERYRIGAKAAKDKLGDSQAVAGGYTGILSANWGMTSGALALLYVLYAYAIRDTSAHTTHESEEALKANLIESPKKNTPQNTSAQQYVNQPTLISQIGNPPQGLNATTASLQG